MTIQPDTLERHYHMSTSCRAGGKVGSKDTLLIEKSLIEARIDIVKTDESAYGDQTCGSWTGRTNHNCEQRVVPATEQSSGSMVFYPNLFV